MNGNKVLLDTNIIIDIFTGNQKVIQKVENIKIPLVSVITIGELYFGAEKSQHTKRHLKQINEFVNISDVLVINIATTKIYGKLKNELKIKGKPVPENDLWIAAICIQHKLSLMTNDKHFLVFDNLDLIK